MRTILLIALISLGLYSCNKESVTPTTISKVDTIYLSNSNVDEYFLKDSTNSNVQIFMDGEISPYSLMINNKEVLPFYDNEYRDTVFYLNIPEGGHITVTFIKFFDRDDLDEIENKVDGFHQIDVFSSDRIEFIERKRPTIVSLD